MNYQAIITGMVLLIRYENLSKYMLFTNFAEDYAAVRTSTYLRKTAPSGLKMNRTP